VQNSPQNNETVASSPGPTQLFVACSTLFGATEMAWAWEQG